MGPILTTKARRHEAVLPASMPDCKTAPFASLFIADSIRRAIRPHQRPGTASCLRAFVVSILPQMAQTKHQIEALLVEAGSNGPRHRFGQNFMIDQNLVRLVADAGQVRRQDLVIEVGPGTGTLTEELLERAGE